jgi:hypothetical protein
MKPLMYILIILLGIFLITLVIGLLLPNERTITRETVYHGVSPQTVYEIVTNNEDYHYRSDLKELNIIERTGDFEVWEEVSKSGSKIVFRTKLKEPYSRYEFEIIKAAGFTGYWVGEFDAVEGRTRFRATEHVRIKNSFIKILSYLFFDLGKFMETYQHDLGVRIKQEPENNIN